MRNPFKNERGSALPAAAGVLLVITILAAAAGANSEILQRSSTRDSNSKRALAAAEAGVQAAQFRLSMLKPSTSQCLTNVVVSCPATGYQEDLGNGAQYRYWVSPVLAAGSTCSALPGYVASGTERCITSQGTVNGVTRRIQTRVSSISGPPIFGEAGVIGKDFVYFYNSNVFNSSVGSNGLITLYNSVEVYGSLLLPPTAPNPVLGTSYKLTGTVNKTHAEWQLPPADFTASRTSNQNLTLPSHAYTHTTGSGPAGNNRSFFLHNGQDVTIQPGTYNFCNFYVSNSNALKLPTGSGVVKIYIDSGPDSGCAVSDYPEEPGQAPPLVHTGQLTIDNSQKVNENTKQAERLQFFVRGTGKEGTPVPPNHGREDVFIDNSALFWGVIYAPDSAVYVNNSATLEGGIASRSAYFNNSVNFTVPNAVKTIPGFGGGPTSRRGWFECIPAVPANPHANC